MDFKQSTIGEILESEKEMVLKGAERYGEYYVNAAEFNHLLNEFLVSINPDRFIFAAFLSQVRKHHTLALFSIVRLHNIQAMMDMRQVLEAGACAAYAIANVDIKDFADVDDQGAMNSTDNLTKKRYKWLDDNYKDGSDGIKNMKSSINCSTAHANLVYAHNNFNLNAQKRDFETPFFDFEDEYYIKTELWMAGNVMLGLLDLFFGVNKGRGVIKFANDFIQRLKKLEKQNIKLKEELMNTERYKSSKKILFIE